MPMSTPEEQRAYQREWIANRRAEWMAGKSCVLCGSTDRLEVDHIDRSTKIHHGVWSWRKERRDAELAKCQVLCRAHHLIKTQTERGLPLWEHGTHSVYAGGCRCELCRSGQSQRMKEWRSRAGYSYETKKSRRLAKHGLDKASNV